MILLVQIDKAEAVLLQIKKEIVEKQGDKEILKKLSKEFYNHLPHVVRSQTDIGTVKDLARKQDFCQVGTLWNFSYMVTTYCSNL